MAKKIDSGYLIADIKHLKEKYEQLEKKHEKLLASINSGSSRCEFEIDFSIMNVFSVERCVKDDTEITIVGYWRDKEKGVVGEWNLYCSRERHTEIVEKFNKWMENKSV